MNLKIDSRVRIYAKDILVYYIYKPFFLLRVDKFIKIY